MREPYIKLNTGFGVLVDELEDKELGRVFRCLYDIANSGAEPNLDDEEARGIIESYRFNKNERMVFHVLLERAEMAAEY